MVETWERHLPIGVSQSARRGGEIGVPGQDHPLILRHSDKACGATFGVEFAGGFDLVLKVFISIRDRCWPAWIPSSRRTVEPIAPPLKRIENEAPQVQSRNSGRIFENRISPRSGDDLAECKRAGHPFGGAGTRREVSFGLPNRLVHEWRVARYWLMRLASR
jgi:hypothetical protein